MYPTHHKRHVCVTDFKLKLKLCSNGKGVGRPSLHKLKALIASLKGTPIDPIPTSRAGRVAGGRVLNKVLLTISIMVSLPGTHLPIHIFDSLGTFLQDNCVAGLFSYEVGGKEGNGHAQGILR